MIILVDIIIAYKLCGFITHKMEKLGLTKERLKNARDKEENDYHTVIDKLNDKENELIKRMEDLNKEKLKTSTLHGDIHVSNDDLVQINVGGTIITVKRSILTWVKGSRMEVLFSGRYCKVIQRDVHGRIFLDVNPVVFQFIVDYLTSLMDAEESGSFPDFPMIDGETFHLVPYHLELFGITLPMLPDSSIVTAEESNYLHNWLEEIDQVDPTWWNREKHVKKSSDGQFKLIYRSSRDGLSNREFRWKMGNHAERTITIIETTCGIVLGGYSNIPWTWDRGYTDSTKTFLFVLRKSNISSPVKLNQSKTCYDGDCAVYNDINQGASFGSGHDLEVDDSVVKLNIGCTYEAGPFALKSAKSFGIVKDSFTIKEMEVFHVTEKPSSGAIAQQSNGKETSGVIPKYKSVSGFSDAINKAIGERQESLRLAEVEVSQLETAFKGEKAFIDTFAAGDAKNVVTLNVNNNTMLATNRATLCIVEDSVLAKQFDDAKWTEQGRGNIKVLQWNVQEVCAWVEGIDGIPNAAVASAFKENGITGCKLLGLSMEDLKTMGIVDSTRRILRKLLEDISVLKEDKPDIVTYMDHDPIFVGKIIDFLRLKQLQVLGLAKEPELPTVSDSQKKAFDEVVQYYFPGDCAKFIVADENTEVK